MQIGLAAGVIKSPGRDGGQALSFAFCPDPPLDASPTPAPRAMTRARHAFATVFAAISAAMLGLAAGALWMLPMAYLQARLPWLALPLGALLGWTIARWVMPRRGAALLAALATLLAAAYVSTLVAAAQLAGNMDMGLVDAIRTAGIGMLWSLARLSLDATELLWFAAGATVAAWTARRCIRR